MEVLLLTTLFSVAFAVLFLVLFLRERQLRPFGGVERDALMPLDDGDPGPSGIRGQGFRRGEGGGGLPGAESGPGEISGRGCPGGD